MTICSPNRIALSINQCLVLLLSILLLILRFIFDLFGQKLTCYPETASNYGDYDNAKLATQNLVGHTISVKAGKQSGSHSSDTAAEGKADRVETSQILMTWRDIIQSERDTGYS